MDNEILDNKFADMDEKIDFLVELCQSFQLENIELKNKVERLEAELNKKNETEERNAEQQAVIRSKIDGLLEKLNNFSDTP